MTEVSKNSSSCFLIALDPKKGENHVTSLTQEVPSGSIPLLKSKSLKLDLKTGQLLPEGEECEDDDQMGDSISILEESNSWMTQNDPRGEYRHGSGKPRRGGKKYNRKEKSLGELCKKFIYLYGSQKYCIIALDECTFTLGVERRRIYDIINILESFNVLTRLAKNQYEWKGVSQIENSIQRMRNTNSDESATSPLKKRKKKKSLGILCESFIKQFLTWRSTISLEQAARRISDNQIEESKLKTKVRRLYDIANVLAALNLIEKTSLETRKPAFKWVGERGLHRFIEEMEQYFLDHKEEGGCNQAFDEPRTSQFEFKLGMKAPVENPELQRPYQRLNSGSTSSTFKNLIQTEGEELSLTNAYPTLNSSGNGKMAQESLSPKTSEEELNMQLIELLEQLSVSQRNHPVYKPTPIYPINHFLSNPYSVSLR